MRHEATSPDQDIVWEMGLVDIYIVGIKLQDIAITCYNYIKYYIYILLFVTRLSININKHRDIV
jgi:hypothetical protein